MSKKYFIDTDMYGDAYSFDTKEEALKWIEEEQDAYSAHNYKLYEVKLLGTVALKAILE